MVTGYYLQDYPNPNTAQYGWLRSPLGQPGPHLSGVIGVHTSEAITDFEGVDNNAENNAAFLARRSDHGSYTTSADADTIVPLIHPAWSAWADTTNNAHAMSVSGCLQAARWMEMTPQRRRAVVINMGIAAARMVLTAVADGYLAAPTPARRISAAEAISGSRPGFYGHGETNPGTRYDPGEHFDWALFLSAYQQAVTGSASIGFQNDSITPITDATPTPSEEDDMFTDDDRRLLADVAGRISKTNGNVLEQGGLTRKDVATVHQTIIRDVGGQLGQIREGVNQHEAIDVDALALELAGKLEQRDLEALAAQLTIRVKGA